MTGTGPDTPGSKRPDDRALELLRRSAAVPDAAADTAAKGPSTTIAGAAGPRPSVVVAPSRSPASSGGAEVRSPVAHRAPPVARRWAMEVRDRSERTFKRTAAALERLATRASAASEDWRVWIPASRIAVMVTVAIFVPSTTLFDLDPEDPAAEVMASGTRGIAIAGAGSPPPAAAPQNRGAEGAAGVPGRTGRPPARDEGEILKALQARVAEAENRPREAAGRNNAAAEEDRASRAARLLDGRGGAAAQPNRRPPAAGERDDPSEEGEGDGDGSPGSKRRAAGAGDKGPGEDGASDPARRASGGAARGEAAAAGAGAGAAEGQRGAGAGSAVASAPPGGAPGQASAAAEAALPEECPAEAPKEPVVLVFDGSVSMGLPLDIPLDLETELDRRMDAGDNEARLEYRRWLALDTPKRIETAKAAVNVMLAEADPKLQIGAVAFTGCLEIATHPFVSLGGRAQLGAFIGGVTPHRGGATPLTASVRAALGLLAGSEGGGQARIVVMTDGQETCAGDLCALAADIAKGRPGVRVDVIDMSGRSNAACLAEATGGRTLNHAGVRGGISLGSLLVRTANQCAAGAKNVESQRQ